MGRIARAPRVPQGGRGGHRKQDPVRPHLGITTALVSVATVAAVAAVISYRHAYELLSTHGESGVTARIIPFTVNGLILAASMLILDANGRRQPVSFVILRLLQRIPSLPGRTARA